MLPPMSPLARMCPFAALIAALTGCTPAPHPVSIEDADAWCDDAGEVWTFWAKVNHTDGPRAVEWVVMEAALELADGELDSLYLAELEYQAEGEWSGALENGTTGLDCDSTDDHAFLFTAQDVAGEQSFYDYYESLE